MAYLEGGTKVHEIERDDGKVDEINSGWYFKPFREWRSIEQELAGYAIGKVLEIGCGGGRVSKYLESQGHEVIGIDLSPLALQAAMIYGASDCRFIDANDMDFPEDYFDTASMLGNGLGLGGDMGSCKKMLSRLSRIISSGGVILATSRDTAKTDNPVHLAYHRMNRGLGKPIGQIRIRVNFEGRKGDWFDLLFLDVDQIGEAIRGTSWKMEKLIQSDDPKESLYGVVLRNTK